MLCHQAADRGRSLSGPGGPRAGHWQDSSDHRQGRHPVHGRLRQDLSVHHECQHQERRWDGVGVSCGRAAQGHGVRPVPSHRAPFTGILITEAARAEGGWLLNKDGYRYLQDYDLGKPTPEPKLRSMELGPRDRVSQAFVHEQEKGRTVETPYGHVVYLDLRHLGAELIDTKLPFVRELCCNYQHIDPVTELVPVRPVVH